MSMSKFASREDYYKAEIERLQSKLAACGGDNAKVSGAPAPK